MPKKKIIEKKHKKRKAGVLSSEKEQILTHKELHLKHRKKIIWFGTILAGIILFFVAGAAFAKAPTIQTAIRNFTKPKPKLFTQSTTKLRDNVQTAIEMLAKQEIKENKANEVLQLDGSIEEPDPSILQTVSESLSELTTTDPSEKAKRTLKRIDRKIAKLRKLLKEDRSDMAIDEAATLISDIGKDTDGIATDPKLQTDREVLTLLIQQYNRLTLIIQQIEDTLPLEAYLKIENARQKYLVVTATNSINAAPNLDAIHNIGVAEVTKMVGEDYAELKTIEIISDFEDGLNPQAKEKLHGLEKELALEFEKRMLKLLKDVRERKLQEFTTLSFGNPMQQVKAFERLKGFLTDREMILEMETLRELATKRLEDRTQKKIGSKLDSKELESLIKNVTQKDFVTKAKLGYNPVSEHADARILPPAPQIILQLQQLKTELPKDKVSIDTAIKAESLLVAENLLNHISDNELFNEYFEFIKQNPDVEKTLTKYVGKTFVSQLEEKRGVIANQHKKDEQKVYEEMQRTVQKIFLSDKQTDLEKRLPSDVQQELLSLKKQLPERNIPQMILPEGIVLAETALLPDDVREAIVLAAEGRLHQKEESADVKLDLALSAHELGIAQPRILPGNILYPIKTLFHRIRLLLTFDPIKRAELFVKYANEKTLETAILIQRSQSRETISRVLGVMEELQDNFATVKSKGKDLNDHRKVHPEEVDELVDKIIINGLARQTLFSAIEDKVYGEDFIRVERIRQSVLSDGVSVLLELADHDTQKLVNRLEAAIEKQSGSQLKEIKAIGLLTEIKRTQPKEVGAILEVAEAHLAKKLEEKLLAIPKEERTKRVLGYAKTFPGNPVRQFESYDQLKDHFKNPETILLVAALKDKAVINLKNRISEIHDQQLLAEFIREVVGSNPEDLKIITEIELRVTAPQASEATETEEKLAEIKSELSKNIVETYKDNPQGLLQSDLFNNLSHEGHTSVIDVTVVRELAEILESTPDVSQEVVEVIQHLENQVIDDFIETVSNTDLSSSEGVQDLEPIPQVIETLIELEQNSTPEQVAAIENAIEHEVEIIQEHIANEIDDLDTLNEYLSQIQENPIVLEVIQEVGGSEFTQVVNETTNELTQSANNETAALEETVNQIQDEIFGNNPSPIVETLPETVQEEIQEILQEVPAVQIPQVTVEVEVTTPVPTAIPTFAPTIAPFVPTTMPVVETVAPVEVQQAAPTTAPVVPGI